MDFEFRTEELEDERLDVHVLFARYMRVSPAETEAMPVRLRNRYLKKLARLIKAENKPETPGQGEDA